MVSTASGQVIASLDRASTTWEFRPVGRRPDDGRRRSWRLATSFRSSVWTRPRGLSLRRGMTFARGSRSSSALSPDGRWIAVNTLANEVMWVLGNRHGPLDRGNGWAHPSPISGIAYSGDGGKRPRRYEGTIKVWADPGKLNPGTHALRTLKGHRGRYVPRVFERCTRLVRRADRTARVWDMENATRRPDLERSGVSSWSRYSPDGQLIATAGRKLRLWDAATGRLVRELSPATGGSIPSVFLPPTTAVRRGLWRTGRPFSHRIVGHRCRNGTSAVVRGDRRARLLGGETSARRCAGVLARWEIPGRRVRSKALGSTTPEDANPLGSGMSPMPRLIHRLKGHTAYCLSLEFSRDGALLASASRDGMAILWSTATWTAMQTLQNPDKNSTRREDGDVEDRPFHRTARPWPWPVVRGTSTCGTSAPGSCGNAPGALEQVSRPSAFSPDGRTLASGSSDQTLRLWNTETRRELMQLDPGSVELDPILTLAFSPDGKQLLAGGRKHRLLVRQADGLERSRSGRRKIAADCCIRTPISRAASACCPKTSGCTRRWTSSTRTMCCSGGPCHHAGPRQASRNAWAEAVAAFDRLASADPSGAEASPRTPGLLRLATALVHQDRPADATALVQGVDDAGPRTGLQPWTRRESASPARSRTALSG